MRVGNRRSEVELRPEVRDPLEAVAPQRRAAGEGGAADGLNQALDRHALPCKRGARRRQPPPQAVQASIARTRRHFVGWRGPARRQRAK